MRTRRLIACVLAGLTLGGLVSLAFWPADDAPSAKAALLMRQNEELAKLVDAAEKGTLLDFDGVLAVVDDAVVHDLLNAATPFQAEVGSGFQVRIDHVDAAFGDGVALVTLIGTASLGGASVGSPVKVLGFIDTVDLSGEGTLRCRLGVLGVEAEAAEALGRRDPVGRLTAALAHGGLSLLVPSFEVPVRIEDRLSIPAVESKRVHIEADDLPLSVSASRIKVFGGRLWVFLDVAIAPLLTTTRSGASR